MRVREPGGSCLLGGGPGAQAAGAWGGWNWGRAPLDCRTCDHSYLVSSRSLSLWLSQQQENSGTVRILEDEVQTMTPQGGFPIRALGFPEEPGSTGTQTKAARAELSPWDHT